MKQEKKKIIIQLIIAIIGVWTVLFGVKMLQTNVLVNIPIYLRAIFMPITYLFIVSVPLALIIINKEKISDYGFKKEKRGKQILIGLLIAVGMCIVFTVLPMLVAGKDIVDPGNNYKYAWQFIWELGYQIIAIGLVEEFIFRGYFLTKLKTLTNSTIIAIIISSIAFGLFHIFNGNIIQLIVTPIIGAIFAICKEKIKDCSTLSVIVSHGIYNWLITLLVAII